MKVAVGVDVGGTKVLALALPLDGSSLEGLVAPSAAATPAPQPDPEPDPAPEPKRKRIARAENDAGEATEPEAAE